MLITDFHKEFRPIKNKINPSHTYTHLQVIQNTVLCIQYYEILNKTYVKSKLKDLHCRTRKAIHFECLCHRMLEAAFPKIHIIMKSRHGLTNVVAFTTMRSSPS